MPPNNPYVIAQDSEGNELAVVSRILNGPLKNGNAKNMAVDGSGTPQVFGVSPTSEFGVELEQFCLIAETTNTFAFGNKFIDSTIGTLGNGLLIEVKAGGEEFVIENCARTRDLIKIARPGGWDAITAATKFFRADIWIPPRLRLVKDSSDYVRATVRDNLSALSYMEIYLQGVKLP
jgi:hypothetical protein